MRFYIFKWYVKKLSLFWILNKNSEKMPWLAFFQCYRRYLHINGPSWELLTASSRNVFHWNLKLDDAEKRGIIVSKTQSDFLFFSGYISSSVLIWRAEKTPGFFTTTSWLIGYTEFLILSLTSPFLSDT